MRLTSERVIKAGVDIVSNENKYHPIQRLSGESGLGRHSKNRKYASTVSWEQKRANIQPE